MDKEQNKGWDKETLLGGSVLQSSPSSSYELTKHVSFYLSGEKRVNRETVFWNVNGLHSHRSPWTDTLNFTFLKDGNEELIEFEPKNFIPDSKHQYFDHFDKPLFGLKQDRFYFLKDTTILIRANQLRGGVFMSDETKRRLVWNKDFGLLSFKGGDWQSTFQVDTFNPVILE